MPPLAYLTDVEGQWAKLESFAEGNPYVSIDAPGRLRVAPGAIFVFGGDAIDRGPEGRRVVAALLEAKRRQPDQVILLAGNRDINKMRLPRELAGHPPQRTPGEVRGGSRGELLRWIFAHTMGAPDAFEHRAAELAASGLPSGDEAVAESYLEDLAPEGALTEYLAACQLAFRSGETLFVHGGVTDEAFARVPGDPRRLEDVDEWASSLNEFYARHVIAFRERDLDALGAPRWTPLVAYQAPRPGSRLNQASVVYARPTDDLGNPLLPPPGVIAGLRRSGVRRLVLGHTPSGDCPAVLRDRAGFELVLADNSYGRIERGSQLLLDADPRVIARTVLEGGEAEEVRFGLDAEGPGSPLGLRDPSTGELVKARLARGDYLLFVGFEGYRVRQLAVRPGDLSGRPLAPPR